MSIKDKLLYGIADALTQESAEWDEPFTPDEARMLAFAVVNYLKGVLV